MKFARTDRDYLARRKRFSSKYGKQELWSVVDQWPLYCGIGNLARNLAVVDLLRGVLQVPGHVAEFGTWQGANLLFLAKLLYILDPNGAKQVHGFDSFEGLQTFTEKDGVARGTRGSYKGSLARLKDLIALYGLGDDIVIHKGEIQKTLPKALTMAPELTFSLVYCDVDLYEPTKLILDRLHPRLSKHGIFVLDQWNLEKFPGETVAVREFLDEHGAGYNIEHVANSRQPSAVLRKLGH